MKVERCVEPINDLAKLPLSYDNIKNNISSNVKNETHNDDFLEVLNESLKKHKNYIKKRT